VAPLYAARIEGLGPGDFVKVEGGACGHNRALTNQMLATTGAKPIDRVPENRGFAAASAMPREGRCVDQVGGRLRAA
jgi:hypothetical protein